MREEEPLKHFSKNSLRRRELRKNADEKKRGEGKRREEGMFVFFSSSPCFGYNLSLQPLLFLLLDELL